MEKAILKSIEKKVKVRKLGLDDFQTVSDLEKVCFPGMTPWTQEQFDSLINTFPEGQIGIELNGKLIASSSSLVLDYDEYADIYSWHEISGNGMIENHNTEGDSLYGIEIMVHPDYRGMRLARRIYDARKQLSRELNLKRIILGGRIPGYIKYAEKMTPRDYIQKVIDRAIYDPVLTTQLSNNFNIKKLATDYLPKDKESQGNATVLEWTNIDYKPIHTNGHSNKNPYIRVSSVQFEMRMVNKFEDFIAQCEYFIDVSAEYRSDFIVFPEMFTMQLLSFMPKSRPAESVRQLSQYTTKYLQSFCELAIKYNVNIIGGSHFTLEDDVLYNISYYFGRDGKVEKQYKLHITPHEKKWWGVQPGSSVNVIDSDRGKIAILICYDIEFPELARIATQKGAKIIFVPFSTDERRAYLRVKYCAQARCIENQIYIVTAGCVGNLPAVENLDIHYAQSAIFTPSDFHFQRDGIAAECSPNVETMIFQDLDMNLLDRHKQTGSVQTWNDRRKDLYSVRYSENGEVSEV